MNEPWWKRGVVYQIYPKSFQDTTGNGTGDIQGIIDRLDYLKKLGIEVIWLTPIYQSPQNDNGYDISDYYRLHEPYGTMEDFENLLQQCHDRGIKLIMDIVVNHTSTEHEWFQQARTSKDNTYHDYYIWKEPIGEASVPNNWESKFGGSAWEFNEETGEYYLHLFDVTQADLNWENTAVRKEIYEMMRYWLDKGVDGFRLDVINLISKNQEFPSDDKGDGRRFYTDGPKIHEFLHETNEQVFKPFNAMTVGEMSSTNVEDCIKYTRPDRAELDMVFNFHHLKADYPNGEKWTAAPFDFQQLKDILTHWQTGMNEGGGWNALFWCNHDQPRIVSRYGNDTNYRVESTKMLATTIHLMQGTPYIYQGEEIGMTNPGFGSIDSYRDVETHNAYKMLEEKGYSEAEIMEIIKQKSRDNSRTPMQWNASQNGGFTEGTPWIPVAENYKKINVENALEDNNSTFYHYQKLIELRKKVDVITYGNFVRLDKEHTSIFAYKREVEKEKLIVLSNFYEEQTSYKCPELDDSAQVLISNYRDTLQSNGTVTLRPYESIAFLVSNG